MVRCWKWFVVMQTPHKIYLTKGRSSWLSITKLHWTCCYTAYASTLPQEIWAHDSLKDMVLQKIGHNYITQSAYEISIELDLYFSIQNNNHLQWKLLSFTYYYYFTVIVFRWWWTMENLTGSQSLIICKICQLSLQ